jgi:RNA polymerase sigma-70 factor (ECF subfamily)
MASHDDTAALRRAPGESTEARLDRLRQAHAASIRRFLAYRVGENDADDLLQNVFIKLTRELARDQIREGDVQGWLITVAQNEARDFWRRTATAARYAQEFALNADHEAAVAASVEDQFIRAARLERLLAALSDEERGLLILRYVDGMTVEEVAAETGTTFATTKGRLGRIIAKLREYAEAMEAS